MASEERDAIKNYFENLRSKRRLLENELEELETLWDMPMVHIRGDGEKEIATEVIQNMKEELCTLKTSFAELTEELKDIIEEGKKFQNEANERTASLRETYEKIAGVLGENGYIPNCTGSSNSGLNSSLLTSNEMKSDFPDNTINSTLFSNNSDNLLSSTPMPQRRG